MDSNIKTVQRLATKYKLGEILPSSRASKKYMIINPATGKYVHFGLKGSQDYTGHGDPVRLANFQRRNAKWADAPAYSPAWLAYHLLWNDSL